MLTNIILDGELGKNFGRSHRLSIKSPSQALRLIDTNIGGVMDWIKGNAKKFAAYKVLCEFHDGRKEALSDESFHRCRGKIKSIRFTPMVMGAGGGSGNGILQIVVGVAMLVIAYVFPPSAPYLVGAGMGLILGGVSTLLAPKPKTDTSSEQEKNESHYFSGAENPTDQGQPVPLIYGRMRTGAQAISAGMTIDQLK